MLNTFIDWQPTASANNLKLRAEILGKIRQFFAERSILEVETPLLGQHTVTDQHIASFAVSTSQQDIYYLQTSPEYAMKRLLAAGSGCIYQICKAFRAQESGQRHNPEFTMLEWYRLGFNHHQLMDEVNDLLTSVVHTPNADRMSYAELFQQYLQLNIHHCKDKELQQRVANSCQLQGSPAELNRDTCLQLLMSELIEPHLGFNAPVFVYDFPSTQAALARISNTEPPVAERFELYIQGVELANGFHELTNAAEQKQRFLRDQQLRRQQGEVLPAIDSRFLAALEHGLPDCSGVALGIDRLMMIALQAKHIDEVITFPWARC